MVKKNNRTHNILGLAAGLFLAGQAVALFKKDPDFKWKWQDAQGLDKLKVLADSLFVVNKSLIDEVYNYDYSGALSSLKMNVYDQYEDLARRLGDLTVSAKEYTQQTYDRVVQAYETQFAQLRDAIESSDMTDRKAREKKFDKLQKRFVDRKEEVGEKLRH